MDDQSMIYLALILASWLSLYVGYMLWQIFIPKRTDSDPK